MSVNFSVKLNPSEDEIKIISMPLRKYNENIIGKYTSKQILILVNDGNTIVGGVYAIIKFGWLYIDLLWVDEIYRGKGIGSNLLSKIEQIALKYNINYSRLNTGNFQEAKIFYQLNGYEMFAEIEIFPKNADNKIKYFDYFMKKHLESILNVNSV